VPGCRDAASLGRLRAGDKPGSTTPSVRIHDHTRDEKNTSGNAGQEKEKKGVACKGFTSDRSLFIAQ